MMKKNEEISNMDIQANQWRSYILLKDNREIPLSDNKKYMEKILK